MRRLPGRIAIAVLLFAATGLAARGRASADGLQFFGDVLLSRGIEKLAVDRGVAAVRDGIAPFVQPDSFRVANLEGAVGRPRRGSPGGDLRFPVSPTLLPALDAFDLVGLQNNHALDLGPNGLSATRRALRKRGVPSLGGRDFSTVVRTSRGDLGIVAVTDVVNAPGDRTKVAVADAPAVLAEISRLKKRCGIVAVYVHWGLELDDLPTARMKALARSFVRAGAGLVVGTHPHVPGKVEIVEGAPVVYSLGNFLFDQKYAETKRGAVLSCEFDDRDRFACGLTATRVPMEDFLPLRSRVGFDAENERLARAPIDVIPSWSDRFTRNEKETCLRWIRDERKAGHSYLELEDPETGRRILRTPSMPIVRVQPVDVDGNGIREVFLLLRVYSSLDDEVAKRVYIYSLDGKFRARWRGSGLSRPLEDAIFVESPGRQPVLVALHTADSFLLRNRGTAGRIVMSYRWNGFGFAGRKEIRLDGITGRLSARKGVVRLIDNGAIVWSADDAILR